MDNFGKIAYIEEDECLENIVCCEVDCLSGTSCNECIFNDDDVHDISNRILK